MATAAKHIAKRNDTDHASGCGGGGTLANITAGKYSVPPGSHTLSMFFSHRKPSQQRHHQYSQSGWQQQQQELIKSFRKPGLSRISTGQFMTLCLGNPCSLYDCCTCNTTTPESSLVTSIVRCVATRMFRITLSLLSHKFALSILKLLV
jgi:hypothetical protein